MTAQTPEFLAACWTSAGDAGPFSATVTSPIDIRTRIETVAACGYTGFGLTWEDLVVARDTIGLPAVAALLRDNGITTVQLERINDWWTSGEQRQASDEIRRILFDAAPILGRRQHQGRCRRRRHTRSPTTSSAPASTPLPLTPPRSA